MRGRAALLSVLIVVLPACRFVGDSKLPARLSDEAFWNLSSTLSEPPGMFTHSDNLVSNETHIIHMLRMLRASGGVYIGVGPEQNYSYIANAQPRLAFIVDIRRENLDLHLLYKALFELSADRGDFLSRLFSRERPAGIGPQTSVQDLFEKYRTVKASVPLFEANVRLVNERLLDAHRFPLTAQDLAWIDYALRAFSADGTDIHYARSHPNDAPGPSYAALMTSIDMGGRSRSYLASEEGFLFVKDLHATNRIVPVVGDFGGADALRRVGDYLRQHDGVVRTFYGSNVEVYLNRQKMAAYCGNLAQLPHGSRTWYIGSKAMQPFTSKLKSCGN